MTIHIANAPCSWGVDDPKTLTCRRGPRCWKKRRRPVIKALNWGPWSYLPTRADELSAALNKQGLSLVAGTIFDDLVSEENFANIVELTHNLCRNLSQVPSAEKTPGNPFQPPYLVIIDFGNPQRAKYAGRGELAPSVTRRLAADDRPHYHYQQTGVAGVRRASGYPSSRRRLHRVCR